MELRETKKHNISAIMQASFEDRKDDGVFFCLAMMSGGTDRDKKQEGK